MSNKFFQGGEKFELELCPMRPPSFGPGWKLLVFSKQSCLERRRWQPCIGFLAELSHVQSLTKRFRVYQIKTCTVNFSCFERTINVFLLSASIFCTTCAFAFETYLCFCLCHPLICFVYALFILKAEKHKYSNFKRNLCLLKWQV